jgi:haloalkane dehalogenase
MALAPYRRPPPEAGVRSRRFDFDSDPDLDSDFDFDPDLDFGFGFGFGCDLDPDSDSDPDSDFGSGSDSDSDLDTGTGVDVESKSKRCDEALPECPIGAAAAGWLNPARGGGLTVVGTTNTLRNADYTSRARCRIGYHRAMEHCPMSITASEAADLFRQAPEQFLDVGSAEVAYRRVGTGPDVLFVHGWPVHGATFRKLLPHLADHVTCHLIDLPGAGSSRFTADTPLSFDLHIQSIRRTIDLLGLDDVAVVAQDSGGMFARHAVAGDLRLRAMGLIGTEPPNRMSWRFRSFVGIRRLPGLGAGLGWVAGKPRIARNGLVFGAAFVDRSLLGGDFDEFFLQPLRDSAPHRKAAATLLASFTPKLIRDLGDLHRRIDVPVQLVWGEQDAFFPVAWAREMVGTFPNAQLAVIPGASTLVHEEKPAEVAAALLPVLTQSRA